jgi:hypothetical protein
MAHALTPTELWVLSRGKDDARCIAADHPLGVELRYLMNRQPLISRVFGSWDELDGQARVWREGLESRGWSLGSPWPAGGRARLGQRR